MNDEIDLLCLSHLRWDFVYQRPQHLLSRAAVQRRVFYWEEPLLGDGAPYVELIQKSPGLQVCVPHLPHGLGPAEVDHELTALLDGFMVEQHIEDFMLWYYTPHALHYTRHLAGRLTVYDCMDELSMFRGASPELVQLEKELFQRAGLVFTGGQSLYEAKQAQHPNVHLFPSSIDKAHFGQARHSLAEPEDQQAVPHPRLGYFGVIDERMDLALLDGLSKARPDWQFIMIGPLAKIGMHELPQAPNIHHLGARSYAQLPAYLSGWDVALMPFARNDSTRFISPTKTPEYLAGGKPVVSTSIRDVVRPYGELGLVRIADNVPEFVTAVELALEESTGERQAWLERVDAHIEHISWNLTWARMSALIDESVNPPEREPA